MPATRFSSSEVAAGTRLPFVGAIAAKVVALFRTKTAAPAAEHCARPLGVDNVQPAAGLLAGGMAGEGSL